MKKGILLVNLGTPDAPTYSAVYRYLKQFLLDPRVIDIPWLSRNLLVRGIIVPFRSRSSAKLYQKLWTSEGSPIKVYGNKVTEMLQKKLGDNYAVELAMRYQSPSIESAVTKLLDQNVSEIVVFPMFPHYASASTGSVKEEVMRVLSKVLAIPPVRFINSYFNDKGIIDIFSDNARALNYKEYDYFIFSFHGLPQRQMIKADRSNHCLQNEDCCQQITEKNQFCYSAQCYATAQCIADNLGLNRDQYTVSFQSRLGRDPWLVPYTDKVLEEKCEEGIRKILVFSPAFVADCLETIVEIDYEYKEDFLAMGGEELTLVPSLNDDPRWVNVIADLVAE